MEVLIISACSGEKIFDGAPLKCRDLDSYDRADLIEEYSDLVAPAAAMYSGAEHALVSEAVANFRDHVIVDWYIVSAGYGLLNETDEIAAYDCTFSDVEAMRDRASRLGYNPDRLTIVETRRAVAQEMNVPADLTNALRDGYDAAFLVLSEPYFAAISEALTDIPDGLTAFAIASDGSQSYIGEAHRIPANQAVREELGTSWFRLRGELLRIISTNTEETDLRSIAATPDAVREFLPIGSQAK